MSDAHGDHRAVCRTLYEFAQGIDTRDWALFESVFLPEFHFDYSTHRAGAEGPMTATRWAAACRRRFDTMQATQHTMTNPRVDIDADTARCRMYVEAWHLADIDGSPEWCTIGGEYIDTLVRSGDRWLIADLRLDQRWRVGNADVLELAAS